MKTTVDGFIVVPRMWYYLLDYVDAHPNILIHMFDQTSLRALTCNQIKTLFAEATSKDFANLGQK